MKLGLILNTRPISESNRTTNAFKKYGFEVIQYPCIEIIASNKVPKCLSLLNNIQAETIFIFTSIQSVNYAFKILPNWKIPTISRIIAVGDKTADQLKRHISNKIYVPKLQKSEGIISLLTEWKTLNPIALISAKSGRQEIQNYANQNNIDLTQINVYQRQVPTNNQSIEKELGRSDLCVLATSVATLKNLKVLLEEKQWADLKNKLIVCASDRIENIAHEMGLGKTFNTNSANPDNMAQSVYSYVSQLKKVD